MSAIENLGADPLKKVVTGDRLRIPAQTYNAFIDAALATKNCGKVGQSRVARGVYQSGVILVENGGETDLDRFNIMELSSPILGPDDNIYQFQTSVKMSGGVPASVAPWNPVAVLLEPIAAGRIGKAVISGVVVCQVNMVRSTDTFADVTPGESGYLTSSTCGQAEILWAESAGDTGGEDSGDDYEGGDDSDASDPVWAVVRIGRNEVSSQVVYVDDSTSAMMQLPNDDGLYQGTISSIGSGFDFTQAGPADTPTCWICVNGLGQIPQPPLYQDAASFIGTYIGLVTSGGESDPRPLYNVQLQGLYPLSATAQSDSSDASVSVKVSAGASYGDAFTIDAHVLASASLNIASGEVIDVAFDFRLGGYKLIDPSVYDDMVGAMKYMAIEGDGAPRGWAKMDGVGNSSDNGGSGINMMSFFPYGGTSPDDTAGGGTQTTASNTVAGVTGSESADAAYGDLTGGTNIPAAGHTHTIPALTIPALDQSLPPYKTVIPIERLNTPS